MTDYRIETLRSAVTVTLSDGQELRGDVFVRPVSRFRTTPQSPVDFLNEDDPFFVLAVADDAPVLVAKSAVTRAVTVLPPNDETQDPALLGIGVEITTADGAVCSGWLFPDTRADRARLIDFLNGYHARFLAVFDAHHLTLVNREAITQVREAH